jgi:hypothetical protein
MHRSCQLLKVWEKYNDSVELSACLNNKARPDRLPVPLGLEILSCETKHLAGEDGRVRVKEFPEVREIYCGHPQWEDRRWKPRQQPSIVPEFIPPVSEVTSQVMPSTGTDIYEQVGEAWLGIRENRMSPEVQEAIASRRFTAEIDQGTEQMILTSDPEQPSGPVSAPVPHTTAPGPTRSVPIRRTSDDKILASRKRRRHFTEYRKRPTDSSSSNIQDSPRKKRRINTSSSSDKQSPPSPRKDKRVTKRAPTAQERLLAGQVRDVSEGVRRLSTQSLRSAQHEKHRSSCITT